MEEKDNHHKHEKEENSHETHEHHEKTHEHDGHAHNEHDAHKEHEKHDSSHKAAHKPAHEQKTQHKTKHKTKEKTHHAEQHKAAPKKTKTNYMPYVIGGIVLVVIIALIIRAMSGPAPTNVDDPEKYGSTDVTFYVMSQCPYGIQVENAIEPVLAELGENIDFRLEFIVSETASGFNSLHGPPEVEGNKVQLCVQDMYPKDLIDFVVCQNKDPRDLKASVEKCAEDTEIDAAKVVECTDGEKGNELLSESGKKSIAANAGGSPTIYIGGQLYQSGRDAESFKRAICAGLDDHPNCADVSKCSNDVDCSAEPGKVGICENPGKKDAKCTYKDDAAINLAIVTSKDCATCDTAQIISVLSQVFFNMDIEQVEASSSKGQSMIKTLGLEKAPALVFSEGLDQTYAWSVNENMHNAFVKKGKYYVMLDAATGASYILDPAERKKMDELVGVKKGDNRPQIDFYVMSYCPYGNIAEEAIEPAYRLLGDKADFNPHYVIYSNYQGGGPSYCVDAESKYCSMHGVQEMNQGVRELCVAKYMGMDAYFDFVLEMNKACNYQNADSCWEPVAKDLKLDTAKIKSCEKDEGISILSKELALNKALGVSGSPTVFVEGQAYGGARAAAGYAQSLCAGFDTLPDECSAESLGTLGAAPESPATAAGGCG